MLWSPVLNSLRFVGVTEDGYLSNTSNQDEDYPNFINYGYCQKVQSGEDERLLQWHASYDTGAGEDDFVHFKIVALDSDKNPGSRVVLVDDITTTYDVANNKGLIKSAVEGLDGQFYNIWEAAIDLGALAPGFYFIRIEGYDADPPAAPPGDAIDQLDSEPLHVDTFGEWFTLNRLDIYNSFNTSENVFEDARYFSLQIESQLYRRMPGGVRSYFRNSRGRSTVLSQRNYRKIKFDMYQLPFYLIEQLSVAFSNDNIIIQGDQYVSEEGLEEPQTYDRYLLANASVMLESKYGFRRPAPRPQPAAPTGFGYTIGYTEGYNA